MLKAASVSLNLVQTHRAAEPGLTQEISILLLWKHCHRYKGTSHSLLGMFYNLNVTSLTSEVLNYESYLVSRFGDKRLEIRTAFIGLLKE